MSDNYWRQIHEQLEALAANLGLDPLPDTSTDSSWPRRCVTLLQAINDSLEEEE